MPAPQDVLWLGGAQWAGKTSIARLLARRHCPQLYECDFHDSRSHSWRALLYPDRFPSFHASLELTPDERWVQTIPEEMTKRANAIFDERFVMVVEDLAPLPGEMRFLVEGWSIRPRHLALVVPNRWQAVFLLPSASFQEHQMQTLERARTLTHLGVSDPASAQRNRMERDRLLALQVQNEAVRYGFPFSSSTAAEPFPR